MKEYILLDKNNTVVKHICADDNFKSDKYKVVEALGWEEEIESEPEPAIVEPVIVEEKVEKKITVEDTVVEDTRKAEVDTPLNVSQPVEFTRTDELMIQLQEIDLASIRAIRAILSNTDTEKDHKTLAALEKQAKNIRNELEAITVVDGAK